MILRQLFDHDSYTYTYLLADEVSREALLIDPVLANVDGYIRLLSELDLKLIYALDTHVHADHVTALGELRTRTNAKTFLGNVGDVSCADGALEDGKEFNLGNLCLRALYTPGHTDDSYSYALNHNGQDYLFTGDTLLIRGTGRTDFQNGDPAQLYASLHQKLLTFADNTVVYPGHDYKGWTKSTIGEEKQHNERVRAGSVEAFSEIMNNLNLPNPKYMDVAVPANRSCGNTKLGA